MPASDHYLPFPSVSAEGGEIVSHGDLGPWNTVYPDGPVAFIDWDAAGPIEPLADVAAAAGAFVPLAPPEQLGEAGFDSLPDLPARLRLIAPSETVLDAPCRTGKYRSQHPV